MSTAIQALQPEAVRLFGGIGRVKDILFSRHPAVLKEVFAKITARPVRGICSDKNSSPGGANELSPALQRWENTKTTVSPVGTTEFVQDLKPANALPESILR
jgi:hypothetical protein